MLTVVEKSNKEQFKTRLKIHQAGKTDYPTFCSECAKSGIEKWAVCMERMTCTYYNKAGNEMVVEEIPKLKRTTTLVNVAQFSNGSKNGLE